VLVLHFDGGMKGELASCGALARVDGKTIAVDSKALGEAWEKAKRFRHVDYKWIPREQNEEADEIAGLVWEFSETFDETLCEIDRIVES